MFQHYALSSHALTCALLSNTMRYSVICNAVQNIMTYALEQVDSRVSIVGNGRRVICFWSSFPSFSTYTLLVGSDSHEPYIVQCICIDRMTRTLNLILPW